MMFNVTVPSRHLFFLNPLFSCSFRKSAFVFSKSTFFKDASGAATNNYRVVSVTPTLVGYSEKMTVQIAQLWQHNRGNCTTPTNLSKKKKKTMCMHCEACSSFNPFESHTGGQFHLAVLNNIIFIFGIDIEV